MGCDFGNFDHDSGKKTELILCFGKKAMINFMSWSCGFGAVSDVPCEQSEILGSLKMKNISELLSYQEMPLDNLQTLIQHKNPVVMVTGDSDTTVPYCENGNLLEKAYKDAGIGIEIYIKPSGNHHPHGAEDPLKIVEFIL